MTLTKSFNGLFFRENTAIHNDLRSKSANVKSPCRVVNHHFGLGAFTLLELIVVVAIVTVLTSLLLAVLSGAKTSARTSQCLSQLRQLGLAMTVYGADNNELLPAAHSIVPWGSTNPVAWTKVLFPKKSEPQILICPSYSEFYYQSHFSYFMGARAAFVEAGAQPASLPLRHILFPSQYILSGDCNFPFLAQDADPDNYTADTLFALVPVGHGRQVNVLFDDLHVLKAKHFEADSMTFSFTESGKPWD
jgi:type II secretory pathway pseudopilin PulG